MEIALSSMGSKGSSCSAATHEGLTLAKSFKVLPSCVLHLKMGTLIPTFKHRHVDQMRSHTWKHFVKCRLFW